MTQEEVADSIGKRIARYRKLKKWSAQRLADKAGLTRSIIANIENGRRDDPTIGQLVLVADALEVPLSALLVDITRPRAGADFGPQVIVSRKANGDTEQIETRRMSNGEMLRWLEIPSYFFRDYLAGDLEVFDHVSRVVDSWRGYDRALSTLRRESNRLRSAHERGEPEDGLRRLRLDVGVALAQVWSAYRAALDFGIDVPEPPVDEAEIEDYLGTFVVEVKDFDALWSDGR